MTCILGLRCRDGVVLGADTEITAYPFSKSQESKIRMRVRHTQNPYFFAYASDDILFTKGAMSRLGRAIGQAEKQKRDVIDAVKQECRTIVKQDKKKDLILVWSMKTGGKYHLFHIQNTNVVEVSNAVDGTGYHSANNLMQHFYHQDLSIKEGSLLAVYLLKAAKDSSFGVGGFSQVFLLDDNRGWEPMDHVQVGEIEKAYEHLHRSLQPLILSYADWNVKGAAFEIKLAEFTQSLQKQRRYMDRIYAQRLENAIKAAEEREDDEDLELGTD